MNAEIIENHSGVACGKKYIRLYDNMGTIACIQPIKIEFYGLGGTTKYYVQVYGNKTTREYKETICSCWASVIEFIFGKMGFDATDAIFRTILDSVGISINEESWRVL